MTELSALGLSYGLVGVILLVYVSRLRRRLQRLDGNRSTGNTNVSATLRGSR